MWVFIWILLSMFVIGVFLWSQYILYQQKKSWESYAKKAGLNYEGGSFSDPPIVSGMMKGRRISFYTAAQQTADVRGQRFVTVIEIELGAGMPTAAALATKEYSDFIATLKLPETIEIEASDVWKSDYIIKTKNQSVLKKYLNEDRQKALHAVFSMRHSMSLFFFDEQEAVLRIETSDPMRAAGHMEKIARKIIAVADRLSPTAEEKKSVPVVPKESVVGESVEETAEKTVEKSEESPVQDEAE